MLHSIHRLDIIFTGGWWGAWWCWWWLLTGERVVRVVRGVRGVAVWWRLSHSVTGCFSRGWEGGREGISFRHHRPLSLDNNSQLNTKSHLLQSQSSSDLPPSTMPEFYQISVFFSTLLTFFNPEELWSWQSQILNKIDLGQ